MDVTYDVTCTLRTEANHPPLIFDARGNGGGALPRPSLGTIKTGSQTTLQ